MNNVEKLLKVIIAAPISEKSTRAQMDRQYVFRVNPHAKKGEIAQAVKLLFEVDVEAVQVCNMKGKRRIFKNIKGKQKDWKKAYVKIKAGQAINLGGA